ncbi:MAG: PstS family phosphate ABC transporter substrate-binding protein [Bacillota bacterium]
MTNYTKLTKIIVFVALFIILIPVAFISFFMSTMTIRYPYLNIFFQNVSWILPVLILFTVFSLFFLNWKRKIILAISGGLLTLTIVSGVGIYAYEDHLNAISIEERGINLYDFEPFTGSEALARLDEDASYSMNSDPLILDGATALYPVYSAFTEAVYEEGTYHPYGANDSLVSSTQTGEAYRSLIDGEVDMIFAAGPSETQENYAERSGVELTMTPIGKEAFVFFVNHENPVDDLSIEEIRAIYSGEITNWKDVGGNDEAIKAFQRPEGSGSQTALQNMMGDAKLSEPPSELVVGGMGGIISNTANYKNHKNALGFSFRYYSMELVNNEAIKHLSLEGVAPSKDSILDGTYPVADSFYAITAGSDNANIDPFIDWMLSSEGQKLVEASGYVPIN